MPDLTQLANESMPADVWTRLVATLNQLNVSSQVEPLPTTVEQLELSNGLPQSSLPRTLASAD